MQRWKATLTYDGTNFHGWQVQPNLPTVQGTLSSAIQHLTGEQTLPQGSGRTDTGVHALGQVASFDLLAPIPPPNLHRALNHILPPSIRLLQLDHAPPTFHARHSALRKTYEYHILPRTGEVETICPPFLAPFVWACPRRLDLDRLNHDAAQILGTHDFTSFAAVDPEKIPEKTLDQAIRSAALLASPDSQPRPVPCTCHPEPAPMGNLRSVFAATWHLSPQDGLLRFRITGSGFLHHMVRNLAGTFVEAASLHPETSLPQILAAKSRRAAGPTAPPQGLFLVEVEY